MVPHLTQFKPLRVMAIFGTHLRAGRGSELVWFRSLKTSPKVPVIYGATSGTGGPNPKLIMTLKKAPPPLTYGDIRACYYIATDVQSREIFISRSRLPALSYHHILIVFKYSKHLQHFTFLFHNNIESK